MSTSWQSPSNRGCSPTSKKAAMKSPSISRHLIPHGTALIVSSMCAGARAQEELFHWDGAFPSNSMGHSIVPLSDVTGDGVPDLLAGESNGDCSV